MEKYPKVLVDYAADYISSRDKGDQIAMHKTIELMQDYMAMNEYTLKEAMDYYKHFIFKA